MSENITQVTTPTYSKNYRACFVPSCGNNSKKNPDKVFAVVPKDPKKRQKWFNLARRSDTPTNSHYYCCQDHLNIENDLENYMRFKLYGGPIKLKENVLPRFFDCQPDRQRSAKPTPRQSYENLKHKATIAEILSNKIDIKQIDKSHDNDRVAEKVYNIVEIHGEVNNENQYEKENSSISNNNVSILQESQSSNIQSNLLKNSKLSCIPIRVSNRNSSVLQESQKLNIENGVIKSARLSYVPIKNSQKSNPTSTNLAPKKFENKSIQVSKKPPFRSIGVTVKCKTADKSTSTDDLEAYTTKSTVNYTCPANNLRQLDADLASLSVGTETTTKTISEYKPSSGEIQDSEEWDLHIKRNALNLTSYFITTDPKRYIGIAPEWLWLLEHLSTATGISTDDIKLTLMKIKLNDTFVRLGNQFGISSTKASNVFNTTVLKIAPVLEKLIYFPDKKTVIKAMPIQFRANYYHVRAIIDAFEIEIQKPSNSVNQALTWSEYKKGNTLKYLVSCSPDGFINFISRGYGGRISDTHLYRISKLEEKLPEKCTVMADRGFKHIDTLLSAKQCRLVRPPSKAANQKLTKTESKDTKRVASLRIHIERVIGRLREYELLTPHARLHHSIMPYIDASVKIAAALVNLQSPIIKQ